MYPAVCSPALILGKACDRNVPKKAKAVGWNAGGNKVNVPEGGNILRQDWTKTKRHIYCPQLDGLKDGVGLTSLVCTKLHA